MKWFLKIIFISAITTILSAQPLAAEEKSSAPDFKLADTYGDSVTLSSYKQPVLLFFWTTWCPFCRKELRALKDKYEELFKNGVELLAIDVGEPQERVKNYIKNYALPFKVFLDTDTEVAHSYNILGVPTYILIDKKGNISFTDHYFPEREYKALLRE